MAEVATGAGIALAAEEVLSTTLQAGVATYFLAKPTQPLSATFTRIAVAHDDDLHRRSLTRSNHTLTVVASKAYIFGGETADGEVASNDMHVVNLAPEENKEPDYQLIPAIANEKGGKVPKGRTKHAACAFQGGVVVYGGQAPTSDGPADEGDMWLFNPEQKTWATLYSHQNKPASADAPVLMPESRVRIFSTPSSLIILVGASNDVIPKIHKFTPASLLFQTLPAPPAPASPSNAALHDKTLYLVSSSDPMSSQLHILHLDAEESKWDTLTFPTNPLVPGPRARQSGALLPITTGYGRNYLVYLLGACLTQPSTETTSSNSTEQDLSSITRDSANPPGEVPTRWSDTWTLQLPSSNLEPQAKFNLKDAIKPAKIKDAVRAGVGAESGKWSWAEVEVKVPDDLGEEGAGGKLHPGPRAAFGADVAADGRSIMFWGGEDARGDRVGDGWVVRLG